jgi:outer membrane lipoprotein SlyB
MKAALLALCLTGCAGSATFSVRPFHDADTGKMECCEFSAMDWRDIGSLNIDANKAADGSIVVHYSATAIGATAPVTAQGAVISNVATAAGQAAAAIVKITP